MLAMVTSGLVYLCIFPTLHTILSVFIPGLPKDAHFDKFGVCEYFEGDIEEGKTVEMTTMVGTMTIQKSEKKITDIDNTVANRMSVSSKRKLSTDLSRRDGLISQLDKWDKSQTLPSFMTILYCFFTEVFQGSFKTISTYFYCIGWKLKCLMKLTFGYWDDELLRGMQIREKSRIFDENIGDYIEHHDDMIRLKGMSHSLIWQFSSYLVILAKLSEAINESPLFIVPNEEEINVQELCTTPDIDHSLSFMSRLGQRIYFLLDGRIASFIFAISGLIVALIIIFYPDSRIIILFAILIVPERCSRVAKRTGLIKHKFKHLRKVMAWIC